MNSSVSTLIRHHLEAVDGLDRLATSSLTGDAELADSDERDMRGHFASLRHAHQQKSKMRATEEAETRKTWALTGPFIFYGYSMPVC